VTAAALATAALRSLWLGAMLVLAGRLILAALPRLGPGARYRLWALILFGTLALPLLPAPGRRDPRQAAPAPRTAQLEAAPVSSRRGPPEAGRVVASVSGAEAVESSEPGAAPVTGQTRLGVTAGVLNALLLLWLAGAALGAVTLCRQLAGLARLKRRAGVPTPGLAGQFATGLVLLRPRRKIRLLLSDDVNLPAACGYLRPAVVLPASLPGRLDVEEIRHLLLHEVAHLARWDDWGLLAQRVLLLCCWWHPVVWWLCRRLESEREFAADALASAPGDRRRYARTLVRLAGLTRPRATGALAPGALRGEFTARVEALLGARHRRSSLSRRVTAAAAAVLLLAGARLRPPAVHSPLPAGAVAVDAPPAPADPRAIAARLDSAFTSYADSGFSGTILVARGGEVLLERGYGWADRERRIPATAATRYSAAGMTKMFTAAAILTLAESGRLRVSDSLSRYVGPLPGPKAGVTLHQLLTYTDGLTRQSAPVYRPTEAGFVAAVAATPASFTPGTGYRYNDFGHSLLGVVIERSTGERFETFIRRRFLGPAGLSATGFEPDGGPVAVEYSGPAGDLRPIPPRAYQWGRRGSLGLVTTAGDLYRWFRALHDPRVIPPAVRDRMFQTYGATDWGGIQGYGWSLVPRPGGRRIWRRVAGTPGFEGELLYDPAGDWTAVILVNSRLGWRFEVWREIERAMAVPG